MLVLFISNINKNINITALSNVEENTLFLIHLISLAATKHIIFSIDECSKSETFLNSQTQIYRSELYRNNFWPILLALLSMFSMLLFTEVNIEVLN